MVYVVATVRINAALEELLHRPFASGPAMAAEVIRVLKAVPGVTRVHWVDVDYTTLRVTAELDLELRPEPVMFPVEVGIRAGH